MAWSKRLIKALKKIDTEYVLFFLEDFFLQDNVNEELFEKYFDYVKQHKEVGCLYFLHYINRNLWTIKDYNHPVLEEIVPNSTLRVNCQTAIWKKSYLLKVLLSKENPWEFEKYASLRSAKLTEKVLVLAKEPVFEYMAWAGSGYGINGSWQAKNKELFEKHNIKVNFDNLGWFDEQKQTSNPSKFKRILNPKTYYRKFRAKIKTKFPFCNL